MDQNNLLSLPLEQKIGQLFFIGLPTAQIDPATRRLLDEISPGGVCLFARNIQELEQTRQLTDDIRSRLPIEPFLSIDQEGGMVDRLRRIMTPMPPASSIKTIEDAARLAEITSVTLRILGFNMNFAPVVDIIDEKRGRNSNGLYSRAFGQTAEETFDLTESYLFHLQENGCLGCLKHFPGLGASIVDSHEVLPSVFISENEFFKTDLFPYQEFLKTKRVHFVMVAHAAYPQTDLQESDQNGKLLPSSLSFNFVTKLLRQKFGFDGIVLTDDLEMGAILKNYGIGDACKLAIQAGEDMVSICASTENIREGFAAVKQAVEDEEITEQRIDESLERIFAVKKLLTEPLPFAPTRLESLSAEIAELDKKVIRNHGG
ncbi:MAG TPA: glycoside hydrolase family 3 N-terminal domain-containing protein [Pyrinomonadaceae bacterium]|jgi:beta-N-acetylhexosaminidase